MVNFKISQQHKKIWARADKARFRMEYERWKTQHVGAQPEEAEPHLEAHTISKTKNNNND